MLLGAGLLLKWETGPVDEALDVVCFIGGACGVSSMGSKSEGQSLAPSPSSSSPKRGEVSLLLAIHGDS